MQLPCWNCLLANPCSTRSVWFALSNLTSILTVVTKAQQVSERHAEEVPAYAAAANEISVDVAVELKSITAYKEEQGVLVCLTYPQWSTVAHSGSKLTGKEQMPTRALEPRMVATWLNCQFRKLVWVWLGHFECKRWKLHPLIGSSFSYSLKKKSWRFS